MNFGGKFAKLARRKLPMKKNLGKKMIEKQNADTHDSYELEEQKSLFHNTN